MSLFDYILTEYSNNAKYLYHFTTYSFIENILKENKLKAQVPADIQTFPEDYPDELHDRKSISLTVNSNIHFFGDFRIKLNKNLLDRDYELIEFTDPSLTSIYEKEVIVLDDIKPLRKYVVDITCLYFTNESDYDTKETNRIIDYITNRYKNIFNFNIIKNKTFEEIN